MRIDLHLDTSQVPFTVVMACLALLLVLYALYVRREQDSERLRQVLGTVERMFADWLDAGLDDDDDDDDGESFQAPEGGRHG
jgi:hypothetical protein